MKPAPVPRPGNRRRPEGDDAGLGDLLREGAVERGDDAVGVLLLGVCRSCHGFSCTKKKPMFDE